MELLEPTTLKDLIESRDEFLSNNEIIDIGKPPSVRSSS
jgi:hypothetical protein